MPSTTRKQQKWAFAQLEDRAKGQQGRTNMSLAQLADFTKLKPKKKRGK